MASSTLQKLQWTRCNIISSIKNSIYCHTCDLSSSIPFSFSSCSFYGSIVLSCIIDLKSCINCSYKLGLFVLIIGLISLMIVSVVAAISFAKRRLLYERWQTIIIAPNALQTVFDNDFTILELKSLVYTEHYELYIYV